MRAVVQELALHWQGSGAAGASPPTVLLFFGCRHAAKDHLYGAEFSQRAAASAAARLAAAAALQQAEGAEGAEAAEAAEAPAQPLWAGCDSYEAAFSRDALPAVVYVQTLLRARRAEVRELLLERGGRVFIAGSAKRMPTEVCAELKEALGGGQEGAARLAALERQGRLCIEAWS
jgi:sulfite reductase alpha subunit-like flavoprotein